LPPSNLHWISPNRPMLMKPTIICVDDEPIVLKSLKAELKEMLQNSYSIEMAESGEEAIDLLKDIQKNNGTVELVISDFVMPRMNGQQLLTRIHDLSPVTEKIMLSGRTNNEGLIQTINSTQLFRFINKPWDKQFLQATVNEAIHSYRQESELQHQHKLLVKNYHQLSELIQDKEKLADELKDLNQKLEDRVLQRTKELVESEKMASLGGMVAGVAHELNTPIGICVTSASYLQVEATKILNLRQQKALQKKDFDSFIELTASAAQIILKATGQASHLVDSFKQVAVDMNNEELREFNLHEYIHRVLANLQPDLVKTSNQIHIKGCEDLIIESYPGIISQIFTSLFINSQDHAFLEHGHIHINIAYENENVRVSYCDDGKGMDSNTLENIFEPFFTTCRHSGHLGLGMHILYNQVTQNLGGTIGCRSTLNQGCLFELSFPIGLDKVGSSENKIDHLKHT